ncbi:head maturation protease, ClpP-related [Corynebacterium variabile]|uniref:head maturation protease, ClpP-related n=1 Tax=Corynebacterium variabile TaxID=1727 RepID=UPI003F935FC3
MKTWYKLARATAGGAELLIFDEIGLWGVDARMLTQDLLDVGADDLTVRINSPGGDVFEGIAIMNALRAHRGQVIAVVEGLAASAASVIAVGGADRLVMRPQAELMIHDAWGLAMGNAAEMDSMRDQLDRTSDSLAAVYADKAGGTAGEWRQAMRDETWMSAEEAVSAGLADAVEDAREDDVPEVVAAHSGRVFALAKKFNYRRRAEASRPAIIDPAIAVGKETDMPLMKEVATRLGLAVEDVDETTVLAALDEVLAEQEETPAAGESTSPAEDIAGDEEEPTPDGESDEAGETPADDEPGEDDEESDDDDTVVHLDKAVYEDLLSRAADGDAAVEQDKAARAAALIEDNGIKAGRLLGWQRQAWVDRATEDYDKTKAALMKLSPGSVNVSETGRGGSDEDRETNEKAAMKAAANKARFAMKPTV